jgi:hypothetical protein
MVMPDCPGTRNSLSSEKISAGELLKGVDVNNITNFPLQITASA